MRGVLLSKFNNRQIYRNWRKTGALGLLLCCTLSLVACGSSDENQKLVSQSENQKVPIKRLPTNFDSLDDDKKVEVFAKWSEQHSDEVIMELYDGMYADGGLLQEFAKTKLSKGRRYNICKAAELDCADSGDFSRCMKIKHPSWSVDSQTFGCSTFKN